MSEARVAADALQALIAAGEAKLPMGSLRMYRHWFGRPHDNWHRPVFAEAVGSSLHVRFQSDELLMVDGLRNVTVDSRTFQIGQADAVSWEWESYGAATGSGPRYRWEFRVVGDRVLTTFTDPWSVSPTTSLELPAVDLVTLA
jgi:hypothetical protein